MAKEKISVKSTLGFGNFPIYAGSGIHTDDGCLYVIQSRIIYEFGRVALRFSNQSAPNIIPKYSNELPTIEMDISNIIRLITLLKSDPKTNITLGSRAFLLIGSSTSSDFTAFQKPAYVRVTEERDIIFNLMHQGAQSLFEIKGKYQVEAFIVYLEQLQKTLITTTQNFDFYKNHGVGSMLSAPEAFINQSLIETPK